MTKPRPRGRALKKKVAAILSQDDLEQALAEIMEIPPRQVVNPLIGLLCNQDENLRWRAIVSLGMVVSSLAETEKEPAREMMRRLMWQMNEESGGIGWGVPESMAEIMANHPGFAKEYASILISYIDENQCFLEHDVFRRGALWAVGRLAQVHPELLQDAGPPITELLDCPDAPNRGLAAWTLGWLGYTPAIEKIKSLLDEKGLVTYYMNDTMHTVTVGDLAREALERLEAA